LETLSLAGDDYMAALAEVRTLNAADVEADPSTAGSHSALRDYLRRHRIHALLDAPVMLEGKLVGVICHESIDRADMVAGETTFAASMGDYVAMATRSCAGSAPRRKSSTCCCTTPPPACPTAITWWNWSRSAGQAARCE